MTHYQKTEAIQAALNAGKAILNVYESDDFGVETKGDNSPLTKADKASHNEIVKVLETVFDYPILSEEGADVPYEERKNWEAFWLIDPLDGTKEFIKRNGEFTVNIALIKNGVPVEGIIYVPVLNTLYVGSNVGAFKVENCPASVDQITDEMWVEIPQNSPSNTFVMVGSRSHMSEETMDYMKEMEKQHGSVEVLSRGSSLKLCMVAEGRANAYPRYAPTMEWDTGAGDAICRAAGFTVTQYGTEEPLQYNKENLLNPWFLVK
jgi:3'(2'), 5'-bisphosphate nucleotidase